MSSKVDKLNDIVSGQPMVVKIIVSYNRNGKSQGYEYDNYPDIEEMVFRLHYFFPPCPVPSETCSDP